MLEYSKAICLRISKNAKFWIADFMPLSSTYELLDHCEVLQPSKYAFEEKILKACIKILAILVKKQDNCILKNNAKFSKKQKQIKN